MTKVKDCGYSYKGCGCSYNVKYLKDNSARTVKIAQTILNASNLQYDGIPRMEIRSKKRDLNEDYADYINNVSPLPCIQLNLFSLLCERGTRV